MYLESEFAKNWPAGMLDRVNEALSQWRMPWGNR